MGLIELLAGPFVGIAGTAVNGFVAAYNKKLDIQLERSKMLHESRMLDKQNQHSLAITKLDQQGRERQAIVEGEIKLAGQDMDNRVKAMELDRATYLDPTAQQRSRFVTYLMACVDFSRGMTRPVMTWALFAFQVILLWRLNDLLLDAEMARQAGDVFAQLTTQAGIAMIQTFQAISLWWFGTRPTRLPDNTTTKVRL